LLKELSEIDISLTSFKREGECVGFYKEFRRNISLDKKLEFLYFEFKIQNSN